MSPGEYERCLVSRGGNYVITENDAAARRNESKVMLILPDAHEQSESAMGKPPGRRTWANLSHAQ